MGSPAPPPPVVGDTCDHCDGVLWPAGETPKFIHLTAAGLEKCPGADYDAPNGVFVLEQHPVDPCFWSYDDSIHEWDVGVDAEGVIEGFQKRDAGGQRFTFVADWNACDSVYNNDLIACDLNACKNGTITIVWS